MFGVVDIGSNTIRLVIYKVENNVIVPVMNKKNHASLAGYVDGQKRMSKEGVEKTIEALLEFKDLIGCMKMDEVFVFATASLRNITNTDEVVQEVFENTGFEITILTGQEEAIFDYYGALQSVDIKDGLMLDIGGGSTELVFFKNREIVCAKSLPIGSLNMYKECVERIIPTRKEIKKIKSTTLKFLEEVDILEHDICLDLICGIGGTVRATKKMINDQNEFKTKEVAVLVEKAKNDDLDYYDDILKASPDRIHTFTPGIVILNTIANYYNCKKIIISDYGVREGYLYHILEKRGDIQNGSGI